MILYTKDQDGVRVKKHAIFLHSECIQTRYYDTGSSFFFGLNPWLLISMDPGLSFVDCPESEIMK